MIDCWSIVGSALASSSPEAEHLAGAERVAARTSRTLEARHTHDGTLKCCRADDTDINIPAVVSLVVASSFRGPGSMARWLEGTSDGGGQNVRAFPTTPSRYLHARAFAIADWRAHLGMGVSTVDRACMKLTPPIPWPVRLFEAARHSRKVSIFKLSSVALAGMLLMVCFCLDTAPPHEGQTRCFCTPKHLGRVGHLLTLPNHRGSRRPRESHPLPQFSRETPSRATLPSSSRPLPPSPHSCPPSSPTEENTRADESDCNGRPPIWASTVLHAKFRLCRRSASHHL